LGPRDAIVRAATNEADQFVMIETEDINRLWPARDRALIMELLMQV
jgi:hypothetical protein